MARQKDGQKFIGESRAPRVQIEYDVEVYGSQKKVELPFVAGVMADLSGHNVEPLGPVEERRFMELDIDNFDQRMEQIAPALSYNVKNVLTDDGTLIPIDLTFTSMESFEPTAIVKRIPELATLLEARSRLTELLTYMDGKAAAEDLIQLLLAEASAANPELESLAPESAEPQAGDASPETTDPAPEPAPDSTPEVK